MGWFCGAMCRMPMCHTSFLLCKPRFTGCLANFHHLKKSSCQAIGSVHPPPVPMGSSSSEVQMSRQQNSQP